MTDKGKITPANADKALSNIQFTTDLEQVCGKSDLIVEAVFENLALKQKLFQNLDQHTREETILASNTSAFPITEIASATKRGDKVIGIHYPALKWTLCKE